MDTDVFKETLRTDARKSSQHKRMELRCPWHKHRGGKVLVGGLGLGLSGSVGKITFQPD